MEKTIKTASLSDSYVTVNIDKLYNQVDVHCFSDIGNNTVSIDDVPVAYLTQWDIVDIKDWYVWYDGSYKIQGEDVWVSTVVCTMTEYSNSKFVWFMTGGDFFLTFSVLLYLLFFVIWTKISFLRK